MLLDAPTPEIDVDVGIDKNVIKKLGLKMPFQLISEPSENLLQIINNGDLLQQQKQFGKKKTNEKKQMTKAKSQSIKEKHAKLFEDATFMHENIKSYREALKSRKND